MVAERWDMALRERTGEHPTTILVVDDNPALLRSVERLLRMEGFRVLLAIDGEEAMQQLGAADYPPDLIVSDIAMPAMDGFEFFKAVRQHEEWLDVPFLFLTARDRIEDLRLGYSLGADDYLVKPLDQERLLLVIRSKLKRRAELLEHIQIQQQALDAVKRELSLMVAHELRTPLVSIRMVADILSREMDRMSPDQVQDMLDMMQTGSLRLSRLVEQMVLFVQIQSGSLADSIGAHVRPGLVREAIADAVDRARQFSYRQHEIRLRFEELDPDTLVNGDMGSLKQALAELLSNAITFSPAHEEVQVTQWVADSMVWITVTDKGPGIPPEELEHVFEAYHQHNRRQHEQQGVGIGLTLARAIIEAHGGTLSLHSVVGEGTQATVGLPVWQNPDGR
jgi:two-component system sensor histidine kinase/response regulator